MKGLILRLGILFVLTLSFQSLIASENLDSKPQKRIIVFDFDDRTENGWLWWDRRTVAEGLSDLLREEVQELATLHLVTPSEQGDSLAATDLPDSIAITPRIAFEIGHHLHAEMVLLGAVTEFGYERNTGGRIKGSLPAAREQTASIAIDCALLSIYNRDVVIAERIVVAKTDRGLSIDSRSENFSNGTAFRASLMGKATQEAIRKVVAFLLKSSDAIPWQSHVVEVEEGAVFIGAGSILGVTTGTYFEIYRKGEELVNPETGLSLGSIDSKVGRVVVIDATNRDGMLSKCKILETTGIQRGDYVRLP